MATIDLSGLLASIPDDWNCQGMLTLTLPSSDKRVKPNVIVTKEFLPQPMELSDYFAKIKEFRGIATRYDKTDDSFRANINLTATLIACR